MSITWKLPPTLAKEDEHLLLVHPSLYTLFLADIEIEDTDILLLKFSDGRIRPFALANKDGGCCDCCRDADDKTKITHYAIIKLEEILKEGGKE